MKIAYVGLPAHGHTNPALPVLKALRERGHEVYFYNAGAFRDKAAAAGVIFRALPEPLPSEREVAEALQEFINAPLIISRMSRHLTRHLIGQFTCERPDLVIYDSVAMWGYIAARTHQIQNACLITTFVLDGSQRAVGLGTLARFFWTALPHIPRLLRWRRSMSREFGAENAGGITEYADLNIVFTSKEFHPDNELVDHRFRFVGASIDPTTRSGDFQLEQLSPGRRVYVSLGTINHLDTAFYQAVFEAFANYPAQFILAAGNNSDIGQLGEIPSNFIVRRFVPQLRILREVDAFITHGGMNSVHEGLYYGVPQIVVPHQFEQLLNGKRVQETQTGILLGDKQPFGRVEPGQLRQALDRLLNQPHYRRNARRIGRSLKEAGGYVQATDEIEAFAGSGSAVNSA